MAFAAVLFDFDGVPGGYRVGDLSSAWARTFRAHGHDLPLEVYTRCIGSDFATWSPKTHLEDLTGAGLRLATIRTRGGRRKSLRDLTHEGPMPGVIDLLEQLARTGIRRAVVSSSSHHWVDGWLWRNSRSRTGSRRLFAGATALQDRSRPRTCISSKRRGGWDSGLRSAS